MITRAGSCPRQYPTLNPSPQRHAARHDYAEALTTNEADPSPDRVPDRFVVLVDLAESVPEFYIAPEWWFQLDVHRDLSAYLARNPGPRASTHHAIQLRRIVEWLDRWDLLDLDRKD